ncbi:2-desacetyl-2-hydroxyethyl bacteriochlorophyllide A dehydrogenase [Rhodovastum atsumiense]|uniref:Chlorophyll synthesis pathway protein BchC n=1 Tax=Rhodovastum atsumiense TaxID=504468 RepID=A0A5M6IX28_9PROT|nr:chlorophyll synthesis pathway protein BchC [Rhodovastum atsumiense]KAA5612884.1 chlorophyll synthesis pathway protein BchC [Rhodovastum atsumiense]CAH2601039.1 2-desacetyl-2-hydroxyethyl bacteriochlorophyllide A dehydrogenase [Rhodovastum atsumiense]
MDTIAVVLNAPERLSLSRIDLTPPTEEDVVVDIEWSGISTGTERLLYTGRMPSFPGLGYPLVPGYESVGRISQVGARAGLRPGQRVFVPGAKCYGEIRGLFGGAASRLVVPAARVIPIDDTLGEQGVLLALAATAYHAVAAPGAALPDLVIGHGVLGRLVARVVVALGGSPVVWERNKDRMAGADGYTVLEPDADLRRDYRSIIDVSGDSAILDSLIARLAPGGEVVLAGFYSQPLSFAFPPAFMREARLRIAAEWREPDLRATKELVEAGRLSLDGLITHRRDATQAETAYKTAFGDPACLKMVLDWRGVQA